MSKLLVLAELPDSKISLPHIPTRDDLRRGDRNQLACRDKKDHASSKEFPLKTCNGQIIAFCKEGKLKNAMDLVDEVDVCLDSATYACLLQACGNKHALKEGRRVHEHILRSAEKENTFLGNHLIMMYGKCKSLENACIVFRNISLKNKYSWTAMIRVYAQHSYALEAFELYKAMQQEGVMLDKEGFVVILSVCANLKALGHGKFIHAFIVKHRLELLLVVGNGLINLYGKCGSLEKAQEIFNKMPERNVVSWNSLLTAYAQNGPQNGNGKNTMILFKQMEYEGIKADKVTYISMISECAMFSSLIEGKMVHSHVIQKTEIEGDAVIETALLDMYSRCNNLENAQFIFDRMCHRDLISCNAMITAYAQHGQNKGAMKVLRTMDIESLNANAVSFVCALSCCSNSTAIAEGKLIHSSIICCGFVSDVLVATSILSMYGRCGSLEKARRVFDLMPEKNKFSWTAMIGLYAQNKIGKEAFELLEKMQKNGLKPDKITIITILDACASVAAIEEGRKVHLHIVKTGMELDVILASGLVNMYAKCGDLVHASDTFDKIMEHDIILWNAMIAGYALNGAAMKALELFQRMQLEGFTPNTVTFVSVLSACSHAGLLTEGWQYFASMSQYCSIKPIIDHHNCVIDLLGRAGKLVEAEDYISNMIYELDDVAQLSLIGVGCTHETIPGEP